jgi:hypothetical protein
VQKHSKLKNSLNFKIIVFDSFLKRLIEIKDMNISII